MPPEKFQKESVRNPESILCKVPGSPGCIPGRFSARILRKKMFKEFREEFLEQFRGKSLGEITRNILEEALTW